LKGKVAVTTKGKAA